MSALFENTSIGVILCGVLLLFVSSVTLGMLSCFKTMPIATASRFNEIATVIAGLVLTVASGVLGMKPSGGIVGVQPKTENAAVAASTPSISLASPQIDEFRTVYTITYLVCGFACLTVLMLPTPNNHDLVRSVGLTTLGFGMMLINSAMATPPNVDVSLTPPPSFTEQLGTTP